MGCCWGCCCWGANWCWCADGAGLGGVLAAGGGRWSIPARRMAHAATEPVLAPVRRVLPPVRLGSVSIDLAFTAVFVLVLVLRTMVAAL